MNTGEAVGQLPIPKESQAVIWLVCPETIQRRLRTRIPFSVWQVPPGSSGVQMAGMFFCQEKHCRASSTTPRNPEQEWSYYQPSWKPEPSTHHPKVDQNSRRDRRLWLKTWSVQLRFPQSPQGLSLSPHTCPLDLDSPYQSWPDSGVPGCLVLPKFRHQGSQSLTPGLLYQDQEKVRHLWEQWAQRTSISLETPSLCCPTDSHLVLLSPASVRYKH